MEAKGLRITSHYPAGHWRAGVKHPGTPVEHPPGRFKQKELERLKADPFLTVEEVDWAGREVPPVAAFTATPDERGKRRNRLRI